MKPISTEQILMSKSKEIWPLGIGKSAMNPKQPSECLHSFHQNGHNECLQLPAYFLGGLVFPLLFCQLKVI